MEQYDCFYRWQFKTNHLDLYKHASQWIFVQSVLLKKRDPLRNASFLVIAGEVDFLL